MCAFLSPSFCKHTRVQVTDAFGFTETHVAAIEHVGNEGDDVVDRHADTGTNTVGGWWRMHKDNQGIATTT